MNVPKCGWCDGLRISCEAGLCDVYPPHECPVMNAGRPLTPDEASAGFLAFHQECRPKAAETIDYLRRKGVSIEVDGIELAP